MKLLVTPCACAVMLLVTTFAARPALADQDQEQKIAVSAVPKAVLDAVKARFPKAEVKEAETEVEDGRTIYELIAVESGQTFEVELDPTGKILEVERTIEVKDLPAAVSEAIAAKYPKSTVKEAEEVIADAVLSYEALVVTSDNKRLELTLDPMGKILETEENSDTE